MIDKFLNHKVRQLLSLLPAINFNIAVIFLLAVSLVSVGGSPLFFENSSDLYGPLASNLRLMLIYLTLSQFSAYCFCSYTENYRLLMGVGLFWLMLIASIKLYGMVNQIPIDEDYGWLFLYLGLSNLVYGGFMVLKKYQEQDID